MATAPEFSSSRERVDSASSAGSIWVRRPVGAPPGWTRPPGEQVIGLRARDGWSLRADPAPGTAVLGRAPRPEDFGGSALLLAHRSMPTTAQLRTRRPDVIGFRTVCAVSSAPRRH